MFINVVFTNTSSSVANNYCNARRFRLMMSNVNYLDMLFTIFTLPEANHILPEVKSKHKIQLKYLVSLTTN